MLLKYLGALMNRAAKGSILLTDRLTILLVPFSTFVLWGLGVEMTDSLQETFWLGVAVTVTAVVLLRFAMAGYQLWSEDQAEKAKLVNDLRIEREKPDRLLREAAHKHVIGLRTELGAALAKAVTYAEIRAKYDERFAPFEKPYLADYIENFSRVRDLLNAMSYDVPLRVICHNLHDMCAHMVAGGAETPAEDFQKLQSLKKIAFRVIYKIEPNEHGEIVALAEVENLLGKVQYPDSGFAELQEMIKDPELLEQLRANIDRVDSNRGETLD